MVKLKKFALFIPSSIIEDCQDDLSRTIKVGLVARAAAIFNVNNIIIYKGGEKKPGRNTVFLKTLLDYIDCPQYLRKRLFPIKKELRSVGVLPPLEAPHHRRLGDLKKLKKGEVRQGVVVHKDREYSYVDVGLEKLVRIHNVDLPFKKIINIKITSKKPLTGTMAQDPDGYWGFKTTKSNKNLLETINMFGADLIIGTSKYGEKIKNVYEKLTADLNSATSVGVVFGGPYRGIYDLVSDKNRLRDACDYIINFIPNQGTRTVRTEEAIFSTMAILNMLTSL